MIERGMKIRIKDNLEEELLKLGVWEMTAKITHNRFANTERNVHKVEDNWVTIDLCVAIPIQCCELI